jgi:serine/threonine-protein kinase
VSRQAGGWRRVDALFRRALDWPAGEIDERLRQACRGDADLFVAVSRLLEADSLSEQFLEEPPVLPAETLDRLESFGAPDLVGRRVGPYRILRALGRGGMASVWLAEREDGLFRRKVALKVVRAGLDTEDLLARFRSEREILSTLEHPNIARLYAAGSTDDGRPYLALEYVEGRPIDEYCDARRATLEDRMRLFLEVGRAVQFAHGRLVIHRDIKPSNILVGSDGVPKLLDFGIAKLLSPSDESPHHTRTGLQPLTLRCASPEQVRGETVTTASDVYQLGLLLYRLLAGVDPYDTGSASRFEIEEAILRTAPIPPSRAARGASPDVGARRGTNGERLARHLAGDLDTIVLKALEKCPGDRYSSAVELVEDVRRHLRGQPIEARRASMPYRVRKYLRRNRWALPAFTATTLAACVYVLTIQAHSQEVERQRSVARTEASRAEAVRDFLTDVFTAAGPDAGGDTMTVRTLVDRAAARVEDDFATQPSTLAELSATLGALYVGLGRHAEAREHFERTIFLLEGERPGTDRDLRLAGALAGLATAEQGVNVDSAAKIARRAYELAAGIRPATPASARVILETAHAALPNQPDSAIRARRAAIEVLRSDPTRREDLAAALQDVAHDGGEQAIAFQEEALRIRRELFGDWHSSVAASLNDLAMIYNDREAGSGDSLMRQAIEIDRQILGPSHSTTLTLLNNYAWMLAERGDPEGAADLFRQVLEERGRAYSDEPYRLAYPLHGLGVALIELGRLEEAEEALRETVRVLETYGGDEHRLALQLGIARTSLARCLLAERRLDASERLARQVLEASDSNPQLADAARAARSVLDAVASARRESTSE